MLDGATLDVAAVDARVSDSFALAACTPLAISDNFDDGVRGAQWTLLANNPVTVAESGGQLQVVLASAGGSHYGGYDSAATFDLRDHCMFVTYEGVPTNEALVDMNFAGRTAASTTVGFDYHGGVIDPYVNTGTFVSFGAVPYSTLNKVLLVREDSGTMTWETSPDGITFTVLTSQPTPIDVSSITIALEAGTYGSAPSPGSALYDNFDAP